MRRLASTLGFGVIVSACTSATPTTSSAVSAPTVVPAALFELRLRESPTCKTLAAPGPNGPNSQYGFFHFGEMTVDVTGNSDLTGDYIPVDGDRAFPSNLVVRLSARNADGSVQGDITGRWFPIESCLYVAASGKLAGSRGPTSISGILDGRLSNGCTTLNYSGYCPASDHQWSLTFIRRYEP